MKNKKIVILVQIDYPNLGSRGHRVLFIANEFRRKNYDVEVIIPFPDTPSQHYRDQPKEFYVDGFRFRRMFNYYKPSSKIWMPKLFSPVIYGHVTKIAQEGVDCFFMTNMIAPISLAVLKAAHRFNIPVVNEYMDELFGNYYRTGIRQIWNPINAALMRRVVKESDLLWLISEYLVKQARSVCPKQKIVKVPAICEEIPNKYYDREEVLKGLHTGTSKLVTYAGAFSMHQGVPLLLYAFEIVKQHFSNCVLLLIGKAKDQAYMNELLKTKGIFNSVMQLDYLPREKLIPILMASDVLVAPQLPGGFSEAGFSTKFVEFLISGTTTVASKLGEQAVVAQDMKEAIFFTPGNEEDLAEKILFVLRNPDFGIKIGRKGRELALHKFTPGRALGHGLNAIAQTINKRR